MLGSFLRVFGLSIAARIGNVYWRVDEPRISAHKRRKYSEADTSRKVRIERLVG
jgi:hypothetical protein